MPNENEPKSRNGHSENVQPEDVKVYEPAYIEDEKVGYVESNIDGSEPKLVEQPPEEVIGDVDDTEDEES